MPTRNKKNPICLSGDELLEGFPIVKRLKLIRAKTGEIRIELNFQRSETIDISLRAIEIDCIFGIGGPMKNSQEQQKESKRHRSNSKIFIGAMVRW